MRRAIAAAALLALAGCGSGGGRRGTDVTQPPADGRTYSSVEALRDALNVSGVPCATERTHHDILPGVDTMNCDDDASGAKYVLVVWEGGRPADLGAVTGSIPRVEGRNWVVVLRRGDPEAQGERVRQAVGGTYHPLGD